jgi:predicted dehydrogenase
MTKKPLAWGLIGGGRGSQIGGPHRIAARLDGLFTLTAGALDADAARGKEYALELGITAERAYGNWRDMLNAEAKRQDNRLDLVTIATPNDTHFEISKNYLEAGFHVLCEKPLTMHADEAKALCNIAKKTGKICATNFGYSGYPMAIQAREMIRHGDLGDIRVIVAEFAHGFHADADDADNPRVRWRYDPKQAGVSSVTADCGIHAMHMTQFMTGQKITAITAQFDRCVAGRELEDDALLAFKMDGGAKGRLWTSAVATGQMHGFVIRIFGSKGGLRWRQEFPNQIEYSRLGESTRIIERGDSKLYPAAHAASRIAIGHAEGMLGAFGNIYAALHAKISGAHTDLHFPSAEDGADMVRAVEAAAKSAAADGKWVKLAD